MHSVLIAMGAKLFQFKPCGSVAAIFHRRVAGNPWRSLVGVCATLGTLQRNDDTNAFILSHNPTKSKNWKS